MKMIISALAATVLFAGFAAPASAEYRIPSVAGSYMDKYASQPSAETKYVKSRRSVTRDEEYIADKRDTGSSSWWQQMDREQRGGRR